MIITRAPFRITLGGGGTDLPSYYEEFGGFVLSAAISKYVFIAINRTFKQLYVADPEANALFVYDYPSGTLVNTITNGLKSVYGVAVTPEGN